jgi:microcystin-dependent protein
MADPYIGEIRMFGGNFAPLGWAFCEGQLLSIGENEALFSLIGTIYGGDGVNNFALPDLRGRLPLHAGQKPGTSFYTIGQVGGVEAVTLLANQLPAHSHPVRASSAPGDSPGPQNEFWSSNSVPVNVYSSVVPNVSLNPSAVGNSGGNQPHDNMQPYLAVSFIIALEGIYPPQN